MSDWRKRQTPELGNLKRHIADLKRHIAELEGMLAEAANIIDAARLAIKGRDQDPHEMRVMQACQIILERIRARSTP